MNRGQGSNIPDNQRNSENGINRREMVRRLMLAGGAGIALPGIAGGHPVTSPPASSEGPGKRNSAAEETVWAPAFLDPHQNETLIVLAERMIPGSTKAQVNRFIDLLLSVDTQDTQKEFLASLSAFDAESLRRFSHPYKDLTVAQQDAVLSSASNARESRQSQQLRMHDHFENIKGWVARAYYSSEAGMKEMGWTGQVYFSSFPGCGKPGQD